jgi:hypothetical protein
MDLLFNAVAGDFKLGYTVQNRLILNPVLSASPSLRQLL